MCGIVGYVGQEKVSQVLVKGLKRLEYRGYDSAGVGLFQNGKMTIHKSEGKLTNVEKLLEGIDDLETAESGLGHTRWATHGKPTTQNAHPHRTGHVVLVHNGIIENYHEIREEILRMGYQPVSETDSELLGFLILDRMDHGSSLMEATRESLLKVEGSCSVVVASEKEPNTIVGVRNGSPLIAATCDRGHFLASDPQAVLDYTRRIFFLDSGNVVQLDQKGVSFFDLLTGKEIHPQETEIDWTPEKMDKQGYPHYMLKEIHEQPTAWVDTLNSILDRKSNAPFPFAETPGAQMLKSAKRLILIACGTSWHAALLGKYWIEKWARVPVDVELASEFRYREPVVEAGTVVIGISQSGETADTLSVVREMKKLQVPTLSITNVRESTIARETDSVFYTSAGPEIGVAATKTFTSQMLAVFLCAGFLGIQNRHLDLKKMQKVFDQLLRIPHILDAALQDETEMFSRLKKIAIQVNNAKGFFFIGRGFSFPIALEGALKLKEIAYIHAEGYAGGELKHGPIAMIDEGMVVVVLAPRDVWREKTVSNLQEVKARGAQILSVGNPDDEELRRLSDFWVPIPLGKFATEEIDSGLFPFLLSPVVQILSYEIAVLKGTDVDQPRNLAKSVTVE